MYKRILVPTDGSALSKKAVRGATELAAAVGAELVALHVVPVYPVSYFEGNVTMATKDIARIEKQWADQGQRLAEAARDAATEEGVKAKAVTARSDLVGETVIKQAKKLKCDLVVMASHGRKGIARILLGSETQHVLTHSTVPVLVLR